jgi:GlpG protein
VRTIGELESEVNARRFSDFLIVQGIPNQIEPGSAGRWDVWVHSDDDLPRAGEWLVAFRSDPASSQFSVSDEAARVRTAKEKEDEYYQKKMRSRDQVFRRFVSYGAGPLTITLICVCVGVFLFSEFANNIQKVRGLLFSELLVPGMFHRLMASPEIQHGQIWRLITPAFLHFGFLHIIFNMLWLRDLGGMIESIEGFGKLLMLVLVSAAISNWAQFVVSGNPLFGGMSGVVYALLGYVWMKGKYQPGLGLFLHKETVVMMMFWLVFCFVFFQRGVANWAHLGGVVVGVVWGYLSARRARL